MFQNEISIYISVFYFDVVIQVIFINSYPLNDKFDN